MSESGRQSTISSKVGWIFPLILNNGVTHWIWSEPASQQPVIVSASMNLLLMKYQDSLLYINTFLSISFSEQCICSNTPPTLEEKPLNLQYSYLFSVGVFAFSSSHSFIFQSIM